MCGRRFGGLCGDVCSYSDDNAEPLWRTLSNEWTGDRGLTVYNAPDMRGVPRVANTMGAVTFSLY